jgi:hypothetical protein
LKVEALDCIKWRNRFGRGCGPVVWQITDEMRGIKLPDCRRQKEKRKYVHLWFKFWEIHYMFVYFVSELSFQVKCTYYLYVIAKEIREDALK